MSGNLAGVCVPDHPDPGVGSSGGNRNDSSTPIPFDGTCATGSSGEDASTSLGPDDSAGSSGGAPLLVFVDDGANDFGVGGLGTTEFSDRLRLPPDATKGAVTPCRIKCV